MPITKDFLAYAQGKFNPYMPDSGTEHMAFLLYSLIRIQRPKLLVEFGSGYSTLFMLQALLDNVYDFEEEKGNLEAKTKAIGNLNGVNLDSPALVGKIEGWYKNGGKACGVDPQYYLDKMKPLLYSFDECPADSAYAANMREATNHLGFDQLHNFVPASAFSTVPFEDGQQTIDFAWNDSRLYFEFFEAYWPLLNGNGGIMIFHNVPAVEDWWCVVEFIEQQRADKDDLELIVLEEPHKLDQNGCAVLRKTSEYQPRYRRKGQNTILNNLNIFMESFSS